MQTEAAQFDDAWPAPAAGAGAGDESATFIESADPDDTGIQVAASGDRGRCGPRVDRVRIGFFHIPSGPFSFAIAVAIHAALMAGALLAARWYFQPPRLPSDWGGGGGGAGDVNLVDANAANPAKPGVPGDATLPPVPPTRLADAPRERAPDASPFSSARATRFDHDAGDNAGDQDPPIGVCVEASAGTPVFKHPAGGAPPDTASSLAGTGTSPTSGDVASVGIRGGGGGGTAHAGLPGALRGKGIPAPDYPPEARRRGEQGVVKVAVEVLPNGSLGDIRVVSDPGYPLLRDAALAATQKLRRFPFTPAYRFGNPVRDVLIIPYRFILQ